ncbi:MAG: hypothetical protein M1815_001475 [Lichina confinis]|nr:MAG: hypothetical protein M1815_001475 [Lichina confinis]
MDRWNDTFAACLECFYDNRWVRDPYYAEVAQESFRNFCNHSFPNITRFDQIPMVELVAGIPPSARGRPDGPTIRERTTHPDGRVTFEPRPSSDGTDGPETSSEANTTTAASTSTDSIMSTTRTTAAPSPTASEDAQGDAAHGSLPAAWVVGTSLLGLIGSWMLVVLGVDLV